MTQTDTRKAALQARLALLQGRLAAIEAELDSHDSKDWDDLATQREDDEVLERLGQGGQAEIRMIEAALARLAADDYGTCARCGAEIGAARLDALPYTPLCRDCAA